MWGLLALDLTCIRYSANVHYVGAISKLSSTVAFHPPQRSSMPVCTDWLTASIPKHFQKWAARSFLKRSVLELEDLSHLAFLCAHTTPDVERTGGEDTGLPGVVTV